jgi:hypothetical protein
VKTQLLPDRACAASTHLHEAASGWIISGISCEASRKMAIGNNRQPHPSGNHSHGGSTQHTPRSSTPIPGLRSVTQRDLNE